MVGFFNMAWLIFVVYLFFALFWHMGIRERSRGNGVPVVARGCRTHARAAPAHHARRRS